MTICCQLSNHCHCSLQLDDWILKEKNKKLNWNLQDSILRKKHWRTTEGLTVRVGRLRWSYTDGQKTDSKWRTEALHFLFTGSSVFSDHFPLQWAGARSAQEIEFPANFFTSRHSVDHDVGQGRATFPPAAQTVAVKPDAVEPLESLLGVLALKIRPRLPADHHQVQVTPRSEQRWDRIHQGDPVILSSFSQLEMINLW